MGNFMSPQNALTRLISSGLTQPQIVVLLEELGTKTTQETISRIHSGVIKNPSFELGSAIVSLAEQRLRVDCFHDYKIPKNKNKKNVQITEIGT